MKSTVQRSRQEDLSYLLWWFRAGVLGGGGAGNVEAKFFYFMFSEITVLSMLAIIIAKQVKDTRNYPRRAWAVVCQSVCLFV